MPDRFYLESAVAFVIMSGIFQFNLKENLYEGSFNFVGFSDGFGGFRLRPEERFRAVEGRYEESRQTDGEGLQ